MSFIFLIIAVGQFNNYDSCLNQKFHFIKEDSQMRSKEGKLNGSDFYVLKVGDKKNVNGTDIADPEYMSLLISENMGFLTMDSDFKFLLLL